MNRQEALQATITAMVQKGKGILTILDSIATLDN